MSTKSQTLPFALYSIHSVEQNPSWQANRSSANQAITRTETGGRRKLPATCVYPETDPFLARSPALFLNPYRTNVENRVSS